MSYVLLNVHHDTHLSCFPTISLYDVHRASYALSE